MSDELKNQKVPKRKRRTKAEIEAALVTGKVSTKKVKKVKKVVKKVDNQEPKAPEEFSAKPIKKIPVEQSVLLMACLNPIVANAAIDSAKENGVKVVVLEERIIHDYLETRGLEKGIEKRSIGDFLNDTSNRLHAKDQCIKLWMILTGGKPIEKANEVIFTRTEVVKKTNLSHGTANQVFQLLRAFGMLEFTKGTHEFKLNFDKKSCHSTIQTEILALCKVMNNDILRFKSSIDSDEELSSEEKQKMYDTLHETIKGTISF